MEEIIKNAEKKVNETAGRIQDGVERVRKQTVDTIDRTVPSFADEMIRDVRQKGREYLDDAKLKTEDIWNGVAKNGKAGWKNVTTFIEKRPAQAVAAALLLGIVAGVLISANKED